MKDLPVIVVSSPKEKIGSSVLALNLAGALWNDGYEVGLMSSLNSEINQFLQKREKFKKNMKAQIAMPKIIYGIDKCSNINALVVDIKSSDYHLYEDIFNSADTLITPLGKKDDILWQANDEYLNFIWKIKKNQAARGIKYLNWIVVPYLQNQGQDFSLELQEQAKRFGFKIAPVIYYRDEYIHVNDGYCSSDLQNKKLEKMMNLKDVYARHEILQLTDFIWQKS